MPPNPTPDSDRVALIDIVRGVALLGIFLVNLQVFAFPPSASSTPDLIDRQSGGDSRIDQAAALAVDWLCELKFISIFSVWFGLGLAVIARNTRARGELPEQVILPRLAALALLGFLHGAVLWYGDILLPYAIVGVLAAMAVHLAGRTLLVLGILTLVFSILLPVGIGILARMAGEDPASSPEAELSMAKVELEVFSSGTTLEVLALNFSMWLRLLFMSLFILAPRLLADMLLGMALVKLGVFDDARRTARIMAWLAITCLPLGLALEGARVVFLDDSGDEVYELLFSLPAQMTGSIILAFGYIGAIGVLCHRAPRGVLARGFAQIGQMALSCYIAQTVLALALFYSYGLGLFGSVRRWQLAPLALAVIVLQMIVCRVWLARYRFGPLEWVWRSVTYASAQPMLRRALAVPRSEDQG